MMLYENHYAQRDGLIVYTVYTVFFQYKMEHERGNKYYSQQIY